MRTSLERALVDLHERSRGSFGIETTVFDSCSELAAIATVDRWSVAGAERFAEQRLQVLIHTDDHSAGRAPGVLFLCVHNSGHSRMALGWSAELAGDRAVAWSGGLEPEVEINQVAVEAMSEVGIDISRRFPKLRAMELFRAADVVVTMGCGDTRPLGSAAQHQNWELDDPAGTPLAEVRIIPDQIKQRALDVMVQLGVALA